MLILLKIYREERSNSIPNDNIRSVNKKVKWTMKRLLPFFCIEVTKSNCPQYLILAIFVDFLLLQPIFSRGDQGILGENEKFHNHSVKSNYS